MKILTLVLILLYPLTTLASRRAPSFEEKAKKIINAIELYQQDHKNLPIDFNLRFDEKQKQKLIKALEGENKLKKFYYRTEVYLEGIKIEASRSKVNFHSAGLDKQFYTKDDQIFLWDLRTFEGNIYEPFKTRIELKFWIIFSIITISIIAILKKSTNMLTNRSTE